MVTEGGTASRWALAALLGFGALAAACAGAPLATSPAPGPRFHLTGGTTTGPLRLERIELAFDGGFGEATVAQHGRLRARAVIRFSGNGAFRAQWKADGRVLEVVSLLVTFGSTLTLPLAETTVLPTHESGPHELTLDVLQPVPEFPLPVVRYFVTGPTPRN